MNINLKLIIIVLTFMTSCFDAFTQQKLKGKVFSDWDKLPLPGVTIKIRGTNTGTVTDFEGNFEIDLPSEQVEIEVMFIGMVPQTINTDGRNYIEIFLKADCNIDWFNYSDIGLSTVGGVINNTIGGELYLSTPSLINLTVLKGTFDYQFNNKLDNTFYSTKIELDHINSNCESGDFDIRWEYKDYDNDKFIASLHSFQFDFNMHKFWRSHWNIRSPYLIIGISRGITKEFPEAIIERKIVGNVGLEFYWHPVVSFSNTVGFGKEYFEIESEVYRYLKNFKVFARYNKINSFNEISFGLGFTGSYLRRRSKL